jgi:hypothetical protein
VVPRDALAAMAVLMNVAFAVVVPFVVWELWRAAPARGRARPLLIALAGAAAVALPILLWLLAAGTLHDAVVQVLGHAEHAAAGRGGVLAGAGLGKGTGANHEAGLRFLLDVPAGGLWIAGLLGCGIAAQDARLRPPAIAAAVWIVLAWLRVKLAAYEFPHHYYPALLGISIGLALGVATLWQAATARRVALHRDYLAEQKRALRARPPKAIVVMPLEQPEPELQAVLDRGSYRLVYDVRGARVWLRS